MAQARADTSITVNRASAAVYNSDAAVDLFDICRDVMNMTKSHLATAMLITAMALSAGCGSGNSSGGASCQSLGSPAGGFSTTFPATENPISEGGKWINTVGGTWNAPVSTAGGTPGHAVGLGSSGFNDSIAMLTGSFTADQQVTATAYRGGASGAAEIELHLRMSMVRAAGGNPDRVFSYEVDVLPSTGQIVIARWNGPQGDFMDLSTGSISGINDGDVIDATVTGPASATVITVKLNCVTIVTATDTAGLATGNPGIGFDAGTQANGANFGIRSFTATSLGP